MHDVIIFHQLVSNYSALGTSCDRTAVHLAYDLTKPSKMESYVQRSPKRRMIIDFFQIELPNTEQQHETKPEQQVMPMFLRRYQPTSSQRTCGATSPSVTAVFTSRTEDIATPFEQKLDFAGLDLVDARLV